MAWIPMLVVSITKGVTLFFMASWFPSIAFKLCFPYFNSASLWSVLNYGFIVYCSLIINSSVILSAVSSSPVFSWLSNFPLCLPAFMLLEGSPGGWDGKESACSLGDLDLIPRLRRSPGKGNGYPLQYPCLENSMDRGGRAIADLGPCPNPCAPSRVNYDAWNWGSQTLVSSLWTKRFPLAPSS